MHEHRLAGGEHDQPGAAALLGRGQPTGRAAPRTGPAVAREPVPPRRKAQLHVADPRQDLLAHALSPRRLDPDERRHRRPGQVVRVGEHDCPPEREARRRRNGRSPTSADGGDQRQHTGGGPPAHARGGVRSPPGGNVRCLWRAPVDRVPDRSARRGHYPRHGWVSRVPPPWQARCHDARHLPPTNGCVGVATHTGEESRHGAR